MELKTRNRAELKSYFLKNKIPTESNFAELIEGMLNPKDDGLVKLPKNPLVIEAGGDTASAQDAIHFYRDFGDSKPDWILKLNLPGGAAPRPGFNLSDGDGNSRLFIDRATGNVGIGTTNPNFKLDIVGPANSHTVVIRSAPSTTDSFPNQLALHGEGTNAEARLGFGTTTADGKGAHTAIIKTVVPADGGGDLVFQTREKGFGNINEWLRITSKGNVGIGTDIPNEKLMVKGGRIVQLEEDPYGVGHGKWAAIGTSNIGWSPSNANSYGLKIAWDSDAVVFGLKHYGSNRKDAIISWGDDADDNLRFLRPNDVDAMIITGGGNVGIGTDKPEDKLEVKGNVIISGNLGTRGYSPKPKRDGWGGGIHTWDVEAEGTMWSKGGYLAENQDLAENYLSDVELEPGDVVCLDISQDRIVRSDKPNDPLVLGVISTAPGFLLDADHDVEQMKAFPLALCGRVPCKVIAENGSIKLGDLLTTASTPGHAMKATPININDENFYRPGTIIGKALGSLESGTGIIDIFVFMS